MYNDIPVTISFPIRTVASWWIIISSGSQTARDNVSVRYRISSCNCIRYRRYTRRRGSTERSIAMIHNTTSNRLFANIGTGRRPAAPLKLEENKQSVNSIAFIAVENNFHRRWWKNEGIENSPHLPWKKPNVRARELWGEDTGCDSKRYKVCKAEDKTAEFVDKLPLVTEVDS